MERPPTPPEEPDSVLTTALDDRPTPQRNRRPRFTREDDATSALPGERDATRSLPHLDDDWRADRPPQRQLVLDRYRLERRIGAGGFGVVWLAFDEKLEREVAVKVVPREGEDPVNSRAEREARVAARLNHPGIVALYELGHDDEAVYLVSELVPGRTLAELIRAGAVSDRDVANIGSALCDALAHAHQRKVIHRDVKPQNVLVVDEPAAGAGFAKLADFGVAHLSSGDPLTRTGDVVGTLAYMAPEQAEGDRVSPAADVYSLALTLYEGWTGTNPVRAASPMGTARRLGTTLPPLRSRRRDLPEELGRTIDAALDPDPERRPTLRQLRTALESVGHDLSNEGGLVEPGTLERLGLRRDGEGMRMPSERTAALAGRFGAGVAAGALAAAALQLPDVAPPVSPLAAGTAVAIAVMLLPRIAWLATLAAVCTYYALPSTDMRGTALVVLVGAGMVPLLLPRAGLLWSVPALAPLLGIAALGPLFVAVAGFPRTAWRRAGLAAAGFVWLVLAEVASGRTLLFGAPPDAASRNDWERSLSTAVDHALVPLVTSPALLPAAAWIGLAVVLPLVVRGRSLTLDLLGAIVWTAALIGAHQAIGRVLSENGQELDARGLAVGALLAALLAVAAAGTGLLRATGVPRMAGSR